MNYRGKNLQPKDLTNTLRNIAAPSVLALGDLPNVFRKELSVRQAKLGLKAEKTMNLRTEMMTIWLNDRFNQIGITKQLTDEEVEARIQSTLDPDYASKAITKPIQTE